MQEKLKILILIRPFWRNSPKHKPEFETITALEKQAADRYWYSDGNIKNIITKHY
jgi:hypothetical protein